MCKTIKQTVRFRLPPEDIYRLLIESRRHAQLTGETAKIGRNIGDAFWTRGGRVSGIQVDLVPGKRVVQAWRTEDFPVGVFSLASFELTATKDGGTQLVLTHRGVPKQLIPAIENDWRGCYWAKIKQLSQ